MNSPPEVQTQHENLNNKNSYDEVVNPSILDHQILKEDEVPRNDVQFAQVLETIPILSPDFLEQEKSSDTFVEDAASTEPKEEEDDGAETKHQARNCLVWKFI